MRADTAAGLPQHGGGAGDIGPVQPRAAGARGPTRRPGDPAQQPDGGLAVNPGDGHHFVQQLALVRAGGCQVPLALALGILAQAGSGHGLLQEWLGNRDF